jgi:TolA-binding protein
MRDDELFEVVQAFREENAGGTLDSASIRRRVLRSHQRESKQRAWAIWFLPAAVVLLGSAALAANGSVRSAVAHVFPWADRPVMTPADGARVPIVTRAPVNRAPLPDSPSEAPRVDVAPSLADSAEAKSDVAAPSKPSPRRDPPHRDRPPPLVGETQRSMAPEPSQPEHRQPGGQDADLVLYRAAHRQHFQEKNAARALVAWDAYLAAYPNGRLAAEAHFNRAVCLLKVGRVMEAEAALDQIASGAFGAYSRRAADLRDALRKRRSPSRAD